MTTSGLALLYRLHTSGYFKRGVLCCVGLLVHGCGDPTSTDTTCVVALQPVAADDSTLGFSALEVVVLLRDNLPVRIVWDELTLTPAEAELSVEVGDIAGEVQIATPERNAVLCIESGPTLRVPLTLKLIVADGEAVGEGITIIEAGALSLDRIYPVTGWSLPATLSGSYQEAFNTWFAEEYGNRGYTLDGTWLTAGSSWALGYWDIEMQATSADAGTAAAVWRGHWQMN